MEPNFEGLKVIADKLRNGTAIATRVDSGVEIVDKSESPRYRLEVPWARARLIVQLSSGKFTHAELACRYAVTAAGISEFAMRHKNEIVGARSEISNYTEYDARELGIWVAEKLNRIAVYQEDIERIQMKSNPSVAELRVKHAALRSVAEEMGQLKSTVEIEGQVAHYVIEGIKTEDI